MEHTVDGGNLAPPYSPQTIVPDEGFQDLRWQEFLHQQYDRLQFWVQEKGNYCGVQGYGVCCTFRFCPSLMEEEIGKIIR